MRAAEPPAAARDEGDLPVETQHGLSLSSMPRMDDRSTGRQGTHHSDNIFNSIWQTQRRGARRTRKCGHWCAARTDRDSASGIGAPRARRRPPSRPTSWSRPSAATDSPHLRSQHRLAEPVADEQRHLDIEPIAGDGSATTFDRPVDAVLHRIGMQVEASAAALWLEPVSRNTRSVSRSRASLSLSTASGPSTCWTHSRAAARSRPSRAAAVSPDLPQR